VWSIRRPETEAPASGESGRIKHKVVSERLGHASVVITLDTYSHVLPTMQADATEKLAGVIYGDGA